MAEPATTNGSVTTDEILEEVRRTLANIPVNRTRSRTALTGPEIEKITEGLREIVDGLVEAIAAAEQTPKGRPMWHGLDEEDPNNEITAIKKNDVIAEWVKRENIENINKVLSTRISKGVYFYTYATPAGATSLFVVHDDNIDELMEQNPALFGNPVPEEPTGDEETEEDTNEE